MAHSGYTGRKRLSHSKQLNLENLETRLLLASDWQNPTNRFDVDDNPRTSFEVAPLDANIIITELNNREISDAFRGQLPELDVDEAVPEFYIDVTGDTLVTPLDAIQVINRLSLDLTGAPTGSFIASDRLASEPESIDSLVNPSTDFSVGNPSGAFGDGRTVFAWEQFDDVNSVWQVFAQRYDSQGVKVGEAIHVSDSVSDSVERSNRHPDVAVNELGAFVVAWQAESADGLWDVHARTFTSAGVAISEITQVNETTTGRQIDPAVTFVDDGAFAVAWQGNGEGDNNGIFAREMFVSGLSAGDEMRVNVGVLGPQTSPDIDATSDGRLVVVWDGQFLNGPDAVWAAVGGEPEFAVPRRSVGDADAPAVSVADDGSAMIAYRSGDAIFAERLTPGLVRGGIDLDLAGLTPLGDDFDYALSVFNTDGAVFFGSEFDVNSVGQLVDDAGNPISFRREVPAFDFVPMIQEGLQVTIGIVGQDTVGTSSPLLAGNVQPNGSFVLSTDHPAGLGTDFSEASGQYFLATPTTSATDDELSGVWFINNQGETLAPGLSLPQLPAGWAYEGWAVMPRVGFNVGLTTDGFVSTPVSTGRFTSVSGPDDFSGHSGPQPAPPFPGEDFIVNPPAGLSFPIDLTGSSQSLPPSTIVVSVEPVPDNSPEPFFLKPLSSTVSANQQPGVNASLSNNGAQVSGSGQLSTSFFFDVASSGAASAPAVTHTPDGGFAISWASQIDNGLGSQVVVRTIDAEGALSNESAVSRTTIAENSEPAIFDVRNGFVTTWQGVATDLTGIFARANVVDVDGFSLAAIGNRTVNEGTFDYAFDVIVNDIDGLPDQPTFSISTNAPGATIDSATGRIVIPINETSGSQTYDVTVAAEEDGTRAVETFQVSVIETNQAPVIGSVGDRALIVGEPLSIQVNATDTDIPSNTLTYLATQSTGAVLPAWLSFDSTTRTLSGTPDDGDVGTYTINVSASDGTETDVTSFGIQVVAPQSMYQRVLLGDLTDVFIDENAGEYVIDVDFISDSGVAPTFSMFTDAPGATLDPITGVLRVPIEPTSGGNIYGFTVRATVGDITETRAFFMFVSEADDSGLLADPVDDISELG